MLKIEAGCTAPMGAPEGTWVYRVSTNSGILVVTFLALPGQVPEIGDFIDNGMLVKRVGYQINDDTSRWETKPRDYWGEDKYFD